MQQSALAIFPFEDDFENDSMRRATTVNETLISALKAWIVTKRGSRLGNMVGCFLPDILTDLIGYDLAPLAQRLRQDASAQFPEINFLDVTMFMDRSSDFVDLVVKIVFSTAFSDIQELEIIMPTGLQTHN